MLRTKPTWPRVALVASPRPNLSTSRMPLEVYAKIDYDAYSVGTLTAALLVLGCLAGVDIRGCVPDWCRRLRKRCRRGRGREASSEPSPALPPRGIGPARGGLSVDTRAQRLRPLFPHLPPGVRGRLLSPGGRHLDPSAWRLLDHAERAQAIDTLGLDPRHADLRRPRPIRAGQPLSPRVPHRRPPPGGPLARDGQRLFPEGPPLSPVAVERPIHLVPTATRIGPHRPVAFLGRSRRLHDLARAGLGAPTVEAAAPPCWTGRWCHWDWSGAGVPFPVEGPHWDPAEVN